MTPSPHMDLGTDKNTRVQARLASYVNLDQKALPALTIMEEKPWHRTLMYLIAAGRTRNEIAASMSISTSSIAQVTRQPWFITALKEVTDAAGKDLVKAFVEGEVIPSLELLRTVRDNPDARDTNRISAANSILDRALGKPMVHVESKTNLNIHTAAESVDEVERELAKLNEELKARGVGFKPSSS